METLTPTITPTLGHGGRVAGQLASHLVRDGTGFPGPPIEVTLRRPARVADACPLPPAPVGWARAARAEAGFVGWWDHPAAECFVCGPRHPGAGLRLFTGPVDDRPGVVAARWTLPTTAGPTAELLWAALGCPTGWALHRPGRAAVLARLTGQIHRPATPGDDLVVVATADARAGRRLHSRCAIYTRDARLVAVSQALWIEPTG